MAERWAKEGARILHLYNLLAMHVGNNNDIDQCCDGAAVAGAAQVHRVLTREDDHGDLSKFTDQGIRNAKDSPKGADAFKQMAKTFGVTVKEIFWTQGRYDVVTIVEAPDESSAMSLSLSLGALGNIRTESLRAFSAADMATIVGKMIRQRTLLTGIRRTATGYGGRNRQADGAIGCFIHRADLDYCRVRYEMILVLVQLFSSYKRYRYGTSAVAPLGLSSPLLRTALCCSRVEGRGMVFRAAVPVANLMKWGIRLRRWHCSQVRSAIRLKPCW